MLIVEPRLNTSYPLLGSKIGDELYCKATGKPYGVVIDITEDSCYYARTPYQCYVVKSYEHVLDFVFLLDGRSPVHKIEKFRENIAKGYNLKWLIISPVLVAKPSYQVTGLERKASG